MQEFDIESIEYLIFYTGFMHRLPASKAERIHLTYNFTYAIVPKNLRYTIFRFALTNIILRE